MTENFNRAFMISAFGQIFASVIAICVSSFLITTVGKLILNLIPINELF